MKLKNKKTGEIVVADITRVVSGVRFDCGQSLAELNTEWEDVPEEPKDFWYIDDFVIMCGTEGEFTTSELATFARRDIERLKAIGNYFATKEEAEKAVEKLKAWKRLKNRGFKLSACIYNRLDGAFVINLKDPTESYEEQNKYLDDIELLFGGEE